MLVTFENAPTIGYTIRASYAHDPNVHTQGLCLAGGLLVESGGGYGKSSLRTYETRPPDLRAEYCSNNLLRERQLVASDLMARGVPLIHMRSHVRIESLGS